MSSERTFSYNGPLSTYREWDSFAYGLVLGVALSLNRVRADIKREPSKAILGAIAGYLLTRYV